MMNQKQSVISDLVWKRNKVCKESTTEQETTIHGSQPAWLPEGKVLLVKLHFTTREPT